MLVLNSIESLIFINVSAPCASTVVVCPELMDPDNGSVQLSDMVFGSIATYTCETGYILNGSMSRDCMADGQWSGEEDPFCQSKWEYHHYFVC